MSTLLSSLERGFDSRLSYFAQAADAGGGTSRNRRRLAAGRELLKDIGEALDISFHRLPEQRTRVLIPLREAITERLASVTSAGFVWKRREPLLPGFDIESIAAAFAAATSDTIFAVDKSLEPSEAPAESSRSRSPVPRSLDTPSGVERVAVPPVPRPRIEGCPTTRWQTEISLRQRSSSGLLCLKELPSLFCHSYLTRLLRRTARTH